MISPAARELLIDSGPLPVPVVSAIALRQGARVARARATTAAAAAAVNAGRHRRTPSHEVFSGERGPTTADLTPPRRSNSVQAPGPAGRNRDVLARGERQGSATRRGCNPHGALCLDDAESRPAGLTSKYLAGGAEKIGNTL